MRKVKLMVAGLVAAGSVAAANAQSTNLTTIDTMLDNCTTYYNTAVGIGLGAVVVGMVIYFVRRGISMRK